MVRVAESSPPQVIARVRGVSPAPCWALHAIRQERSGNRVSIFITVVRPLDRPCTTGIETFDQDITVEGPLTSGVYTVRVNGVERTIELQEAILRKFILAVAVISGACGDGGSISGPSWGRSTPGPTPFT